MVCERPSWGVWTAGSWTLLQVAPAGLQALSVGSLYTGRDRQVFVLALTVSVDQWICL